MKQANILLKLSKDHEVHLKGVTPVEAMLLTAEHHKNAGGNPVVVDETSIEDTHNLIEIADGPEVDHDEIAVGADGKKYVKTTKVKSKIIKKVPDNRTDDQELSRLRTKYPANKLKVITTEVRNFPTDFKSATEKGVNLALPSGSLSSTKVI